MREEMRSEPEIERSTKASVLSEERSRISMPPRLKR